MSEDSVSGVSPVSSLAGEDDNETRQLMEMLQEARSYLLGHSWCREILESYWGDGIGGVVAVFYFVVRTSGGSDDLWVVCGDLPTAYFVPERASEPISALLVYCDLMDSWTATVRKREDLGAVFPVMAEPTLEHAASLEGRISLLRAEIIPALVERRAAVTGDKLPVFAGLPFLSWSGSYAIHGPIDNYRAATGGNLRRGYVSHGCIRMAAADVLELYARIKGVASVPVHVQREPERTVADARVDLTARWIGAECTKDTDCGYASGFCKANKWSGRGFCSARCTSACADRVGQPATFCVADADAPGQGLCVPKHTAVNAGCRPYDHFVPATRSRPTQATVTAAVCVPGAPGWVGDRCLANADCANGTSCHGGVCTMACERFCTDQPGYADTFCVRDAALGAGGSCARQCTASSNGSECAAGNACVARGRNGQPSSVRTVCIPR